MEPEQHRDGNTDSDRQRNADPGNPASRASIDADQARDSGRAGRDSADARRLRLRVSALEELLNSRAQELAEMRCMLEQSVVRERASRSRAETQRARQQQLLAAIAQELRGPLSSVAGWLQLIARKQPGRPERALVSLTRNVRMLTRLVDDLVDHARYEVGSIEPQFNKLDASLLLNQVLDALKASAAQKEVELVADVPAAALEIWADPQRLRQVFTALLSNAIKFSFNGGSVNVSLSRVGAELRCVVQDRGAGIHPEFLPHVFEAFAQHYHRRLAPSFGGLGLELPIAHSIVESHGGTLSAESRGQGLGASFRLTLPLNLSVDHLGGQACERAR